MSEHKKRAQKRAKHKNPINYTCGICRQVHVFDPEHSYECTKDQEVEEPEGDGEDD